MKLIVLLICTLLFLNSAIAQQRRIYIAPDDHTDYMWSADETGYRKAFLETLDYYIRLNDSTSGEPYPVRSKWNCDGSFWVYEYEKNRTALEFSKLIQQIRDGKITVPLNTLPGLLGIAPVEATIRDMYYAGSLERKYKLDLELVINMEDQVLPLGLSSVWAGSGAKYSWRGVCDCATKVTGLTSRPHEIYWYKGLDDQKILMKWYSLAVENKQLGGYAEARDPGKSIRLCLDLMNSKKYPYDIAGAFGKGWDDLKTTTAEFVRVAKEYKDSTYQVIVSNETDFFHDFEKTYGSQLPSESLSYGSTEWGNSLASLAAVSAGIKRSVEKLRTAEAIYTIVALKDKEFGSKLYNIRQEAWISCGLYFDHDWTADGIVITKKQRAEWARKMENRLSRYVDTLYDMSVSRLGELIRKPEKEKQAFFVFNSLGWQRTDYCDYQYDGPADIKVVDTGTGEEVPFQFITRKQIRFLRILAKEVPSLGYKSYAIRKTSKTTDFVQSVSVSDSIIESSRYRIVLTRQGVITSLTDKADHNRECISPVNHLYANDLGSGKGNSGYPLRIENAGPVSVTLVAESDTPVKHTSKITLSGFNDRIEVENYIQQNIGSEPVTYAFSFNINEPEIWHEEAGAILKAKQQSEGGHYADSICRLDWIAMNHFASMSDGNNGIIISNRDAFFMKTGNSTIKKLDSKTPQIRVLAGGQIDAPGLGIIDQNGDSYFENYFALKPFDNGFSATSSMRFSMEHQNPLVAGKINGKEGKYDLLFSLFQISDPNILEWTLKPSEEGIENGIILRIWNLSDSEKSYTISSSSDIDKCNNTSHIEKDISEIKPDAGVLNLKTGHNRIQTYRIFLK
jgi:alpha-mannosidase